MVFKRIKEVFHKKALPNFIIIGAQKSGTSSLFTYLSQHPQLVASSNKEVHYFDNGLNPKVNNYEKGEAWYRNHFPDKKELSKGQQTFEASPLYIFNPEVPGRIHDLIPKVKLIVVLRNPTERAISQYFHECSLDKESLPMLQAFQGEERRLKNSKKNRDYKDLHFIHSSYKSRGEYHNQLVRYFNFFPQNQVLILNSDDLFKKTEDTLRVVFEFLDVDSNFETKNLEPRNISSNRVVVDKEVYEYLDEYFRPHNQKFYELLGVDFNW